MQKYDTIGKTYSATRRAEPRIVEQIYRFLDLSPGSELVDIGAGTGNYSLELAKTGYKVTAVEPSLTMIQQAKSHRNLDWIMASAEQLPFEAYKFDGAVCTLAVHHFSDVESSFREMVRVVRRDGSIVIFISDPRLTDEKCWLTDYFDPILKHSYQVYPKLADLMDTLERVSEHSVYVKPFFLPVDMSDRFFMTGWRHPEWYLDPVFRQGVSPLASAPKDVVEKCVSRLASDLETGAWEQQYGDMLKLTTCDGGYRFLVVNFRK
jgi:ubiquinone/menaquinone biosynthesis C-methylase UbiE